MIGGKRGLVVLALTTLISLVGAGKALPDRQKVQLTGAGQGKARASVVLRSDLVRAASSGEVSEGGGGEGPRCSVYAQKQWDSVRIGVASSAWKSTGYATIYSESAVLKTPAMVDLAWQRAFSSEAAFVRCARHRWASDNTSTALPLSYQRLTFPPLAARIRGYRIKTQYRDQAGKTVPAVLDTLFVGHGSVMSNVVFIAQSSLGSAVHRDEVRITRRIIERMTATPVG